MHTIQRCLATPAQVTIIAWRIAASMERGYISFFAQEASFSCELQVLGAVPLSGDGAAAANAVIDRADQERKKGVPAHRRKNAAWVRERPLFLTRSWTSLCAKG